MLYFSPCEPPSDEAKPGELKRALSEHVAAKRIVRVAQRPVWLRNEGDVGEPGVAFFLVTFSWRGKKK